MGAPPTTQREKEKQRQTAITMLSVWVIICLVMLALVFLDKSYAQALQSSSLSSGESDARQPGSSKWTLREKCRPVLT
jgi:beta-lactamase regulating signal transducer with metallopeptidase domain